MRLIGIGLAPEKKQAREVYKYLKGLAAGSSWIVKKHVNTCLC